MPAVFQSDRWFEELEEAIIIVGNGARKVEGDGYKVYRIGPTIRCDLSPHWISGPERPQEALEGQTDTMEAFGSVNSSEGQPGGKE